MLRGCGGALRSLLGPRRGCASAACSTRAASAEPGLTVKERKNAKAVAQRMARDKTLAVVQLGRDGVTPGVSLALAESLAAHELVKVRVASGNKAEAAEAAEALLAACPGSQLCGVVGGTALLLKFRDTGSALRPLLLLEGQQLLPQKPAPRGRAGAKAGARTAADAVP